MKTPLSLCDRLSLHPSDRQREILEALESLPKKYDVIGDESFSSARAVALFTLWRILSTNGALGLVLTPTQGMASDFMTFIEKVTTKISPDLASVTGFPRWNVARFQSSPGWEIRLMPNKPALVWPRAENAMVSVIIGAQSRDLDFLSACEALEKHSTHPQNTLIRVW